MLAHSAAALVPQLAHSSAALVPHPLAGCDPFNSPPPPHGKILTGPPAVRGGPGLVWNREPRLCAARIARACTLRVSCTSACCVQMLRALHTCAGQGSKAEGHAFLSGIEGAGRCGRRCGSPAAAGPAGIGRFQPPSDRPHFATKRSARRGSGPPLFRRCAELAAAGPNHDPHTPRPNGSARNARPVLDRRPGCVLRAYNARNYVHIMHATTCI